MEHDGAALTICWSIWLRNPREWNGELTKTVQANPDVKIIKFGYSAADCSLNTQQFEFQATKAKLMGKIIVIQQGFYPGQKAFHLKISGKLLHFSLSLWQWDCKWFYFKESVWVFAIRVGIEWVWLNKPLPLKRPSSAVMAIIIVISQLFIIAVQSENRDHKKKLNVHT